MSLAKPVAARHPHSSTHHGITREDPYHWLRTDNWQEVFEAPETLDPAIRAYLVEENAYFEESFGQPTAALRETLFNEIRGRIKEDESGIPSPDGPFAYNSRMEEGKQYPVLVRTARDGGPETILLDCNAEVGTGYFGFGGAEHDPTHRWLAWLADRQGSESYTIRLRDLTTGADIEEKLEDVGDELVWAADSRSFYYIEYDDSHRPFRVRRHRLGTPQAADEVVYEEADKGFFVGVGETLSRSHIVIDVHDHQTSEVHLIDALAGGAPWLVAARLPGREYDVEERDGLLYIQTNDAGAEDFKIVTAPVEAAEAANWTDLIAHQPGALILDTIVIRNHLLRLERREGLPRIIVRDLRSGVEETIRFEEEAYSLGMSVDYEFDTTTFRFSYSSPTTPNRTYDYDLETGTRTLLKEQIVPSGHDPANYVTRRLFAPAPDGELVPVTVLYHKTTPVDGTAPALLYGYGAYGMSIPAAFSVSALSLVDRGFIHAVAHVRGGMEKGYRWYRLGRHEHKANTFKDFAAAAEMLIQNRYAAPHRLVAEGGSAGGLLMGVMANTRPELFAGIIAEVPFVDVLNTMLDDTLPLTPPEWPEWGNPLASADDYALIASYAPYEQVKAQAYPPILALAGLTDPRVTYWEPAKWVAKLRATRTDDQPLYLKTHLEAGHGGASGRFEQLKETAESYAFALRCVGLA